MSEPLYTLTAERELDQIGRKIARRSRAAFIRFFDKFADRAAFYSEFPNLGITCEHIRPGYRCFVVGRYVAYYLIVPGTILIVRILHGAADAGAALGRP